jgi:hypothetical protein
LSFYNNYKVSLPPFIVSRIFALATLSVKSFNQVNQAAFIETSSVTLITSALNLPQAVLVVHSTHFCISLIIFKIKNIK